MSQKEPLRRSLLRGLAPFLFKECPFGNFHWRWDRFCHCGEGAYLSTWHGGILDFRSGRELWRAKQIAQYFFYHLEEYHPLEGYWEVGDRQSKGESYPYSYFKTNAIQTLEELIADHAM